MWIRLSLLCLLVLFIAACGEEQYAPRTRTQAQKPTEITGLLLNAQQMEKNVDAAERKVQSWEVVDDSGLALFSTYRDGTASCNRDAIKWSGSAHDWGGIQYAPFGNVDMSGASNVAFNGSIIAYNINLSGSDMTISYNDEFEGTPSTIINLEE